MKVSQIDTILYPFYSKFYADSKSVTFSRLTSILWDISTVKVWTKSQKCLFINYRNELKLSGSNFFYKVQ